MKKIILILLILCAGQGAMAQSILPDTLQFTFKLHGQTRRFKVSFSEQGDSLRMDWTILRNLKWWVGRYTMTPASLEEAAELCFLMPEDGRHVTVATHEVCYMLSRRAYRTLKAQGEMAFNHTRYKLLDCNYTALDLPLLHVKDQAEGGEMWILDHPQYPLVWRMTHNPLEIEWIIQ